MTEEELIEAFYEDIQEQEEPEHVIDHGALRGFDPRRHVPEPEISFLKETTEGGVVQLTASCGDITIREVISHGVIQDANYDVERMVAERMISRIREATSCGYVVGHAATMLE